MAPDGDKNDPHISLVVVDWSTTNIVWLLFDESKALSRQSKCSLGVLYSLWWGTKESLKVKEWRRSEGAGSIFLRLISIFGS